MYSSICPSSPSVKVLPRSRLWRAGADRQADKRPDKKADSIPDLETKSAPQGRRMYEQNWPTLPTKHHREDGPPALPMVVSRPFRLCKSGSCAETKS